MSFLGSSKVSVLQLAVTSIPEFNTKNSDHIGAHSLPFSILFTYKGTGYKSREYYDTHFGKKLVNKYWINSTHRQTLWKGWTCGRTTTISHHIYSINFERNQLTLNEVLTSFTFSFSLESTQFHHTPFFNSPQIQVKSKKNKVFIMLSRLQPAYLNLLNRLVASVLAL